MCAAICLLIPMHYYPLFRTPPIQPRTYPEDSSARDCQATWKYCFLRHHSRTSSLFLYHQESYRAETTVMILQILQSVPTTPTHDHPSNSPLIKRKVEMEVAKQIFLHASPSPLVHISLQALYHHRSCTYLLSVSQSFSG